MSVASLKERLEAYGLSPCKAKGQHFLWDFQTLSRMVHYIDESRILEIGPGVGTLSQAIWEHCKPQHFAVIEKDARFKDLLNQLLPSAQIIIGDALDVDWVPYAPCMIVSNLPYNVSVPITLKYLRQSRLFPKALLMFQKEVADRIMAQPGTKAYGRLSVMAQAFAKITRLMNVAPSSFWPQPKVDSTVLLFHHRLNPALPDLSYFKQLENLIGQAFHNRRKMIHHAFKAIELNESVWKSLGIDPKARAENISVDQYCQLTVSIKGKSYVE